VAGHGQVRHARALRLREPIGELERLVQPSALDMNVQVTEVF
jgi:hypothetical protein